MLDNINILWCTQKNAMAYYRTCSAKNRLFHGLYNMLHHTAKIKCQFLTTNSCHHTFVTFTANQKWHFQQNFWKVNSPIKRSFFLKQFLLHTTPFGNNLKYLPPLIKHKLTPFISPMYDTDILWTFPVKKIYKYRHNI